MNLYCALIHYPVYNKNGKIIVTSITTSSIHDISRTARTYGLSGLFFVTPVARQQRLIETIIEHWKSGYGAGYNPTRRIAFEIIKIVSSLEECLEDIEKAEGERPKIVVTCAKVKKNSIHYPELRDEMNKGNFPWLLLFGTGWGLVDGILDMADRVLEPVRGGSDYNHLSVRAAVAIVLDRLLG